MQHEQCLSELEIFDDFAFCPFGQTRVKHEGRKERNIKKKLPMGIRQPCREKKEILTFDLFFGNSRLFKKLFPIFNSVTFFYFLFYLFLSFFTFYILGMYTMTPMVSIRFPFTKNCTRVFLKKGFFFLFSVFPSETRQFGSISRILAV